jgi:hypothetical protein
MDQLPARSEHRWRLAGGRKTLASVQLWAPVPDWYLPVSSREEWHSDLKDSAEL